MSPSTPTPTAMPAAPALRSWTARDAQLHHAMLSSSDCVASVSARSVGRPELPSGFRPLSGASTLSVQDLSEAIDELRQLARRLQP